MLAPDAFAWLPASDVPPAPAPPVGEAAPPWGVLEQATLNGKSSVPSEMTSVRVVIRASRWRMAACLFTSAE
jgi:hypothetical protein